ncbi:MAG: hypothetical protein QOG56_928 [Solirubrobacteraceae bacterium]|nr:hypothetical protein [Solirubrobacteraceae bacterium]
MTRRLLAMIALTGSIAIGACGEEYVHGAGVYSVTTTTPATTPTPIAPAQTTDAGGRESSEAPPLSAAQRRAVRGASRAARRFLAGYLPYSYGRRAARTITSASPSLRRALSSQAPRVPPALARKARPRLMRLQVSGIASDAPVILLAHVDDGQSRYVVLLTLRQRSSRWTVSEVR